jgi:Tfp pilus assembly protein PilF
MRFGIGKEHLILLTALLIFFSSACSQIKEENKMDRIQEYTEKAKQLRMKGDSKSALKEQLKAIEIDPNFDETWILLASIYSDLEDWKNAETSILRALELDKNDADAHHFYGFILEKLSKNNEALIERKEAVRLSPSNLMFRVNLGMNYDLLNDSKSARENVLKALELSPNYAYALYQMADFELSDKNITKAMEYFEKASKAKPIEDNDEYFIERAKERLAELKVKWKVPK